MTAIGGYNQISIPELETQLHPGAYRFQSARAALYAYIKAENIRVLYVPNYMCDSLFPALEALSVEVEFYSINESLLPQNDFSKSLPKDNKVLLVNYFGLLTEQIKPLVKNQPDLFVIDNSQALFSDHIEGATSIYSPRKFLGIPDGGFLKTNSKITVPETCFDSSPYISHLLLRAAGNVSEGYIKFQNAEYALDDFIPKQMSVISSYLIKTTDLNNIAEKRRENYSFLQSQFSEINKLDFPIYEQIPLCYPLKVMLPVGDVCSELAKLSIFLPRYWQSKHNGVVGKEMFEKTLFLPIDERLRKQDLELLVNTVATALDL